MENIVDALKMAGAVLLFLLALSITTLSFSKARETIDILLNYSDREYLTTKDGKEDNSYYYFAKDTTRYVGKETIIPAIYRAYKENYKIVFEFPDDYYLFEQKILNDDGKEEIKQIKKIDLKEQKISSDFESRRFLNGIIYGEYGGYGDDTKYQKDFLINPNRNSLNTYLNDKEKNYKIKEYLGTYYTEDAEGSESTIDDVEKHEKRVITYTFEPK